MYKLHFILIFSILFHYNADSQLIKGKILDIVRKNKQATNFQIVGANINKIDSFMSEGCSNGDFEIINENGSIWVTQNGTSKVFKIDSNGVVNRLDRTCNQGFNYGATNIIYKDTLYSIGGYGFWQTTGSIRYFNPTSGEWDIIRNIDNIPIAGGINAMCFYDKIHEKLFVVYAPTQPEFEKSKKGVIEQALMQCFDFKKKVWWDKAKTINPKIASKFSNLTTIQKIGNDVLLSSSLNGKVMLVNFNENTIKDVDYKYHTELKQLLNSRTNYISYAINDTVKLLDLNNDSTLVSFIKPSQLTVFEEPFYINNTVSKNLNEIPWLLVSGVFNALLILSIIVVFRLQKRNQRLALIQNETTVINTFDKDNRSLKDYTQNLNPVEKDLLKLLFKNNLQNQKTTVTEINKVIGVEKKPFKIQNNIRGEMLTNINNKFMSFAMVNNFLIERQRSEFDKRHMEYFINEKYVNKFSLKLFDS